MESIEYKVVDMTGKQTGTVSLDPEIFQAPILEHVVHEVVVWQRAKARSGTHATLTRSKMLGGGRKPYKQKGTGRARQGSNISPLLVGGAVTFGPQPRDYTKRVSKRSRSQALTSVLSDKVKSETLVVLDDLQLSAPKTKTISAMLQNVGAVDGRSLILTQEAVVEKSSRNLSGVKTLSICGLNVYDLLNHKYFVCTKAGIESLQESLAPRLRSTRQGSRQAGQANKE